MPNAYTFKDFEGSSHRILIDLVHRFVVHGGTLLDLGAAGGELGASLRESFERSIGFEYNVDCIGALAHHFDQVMISDLERLKRLPVGMDAIILADVLEHLRNANSLLRKVHESVKVDGKVFISVPNIANITVRLGLLFGIFEYRDRGILDHTHLRFYTMRSIRQEIQRVGFRILATRGSSIPLRLIIGRFIPEPLMKAAEWLLAKVTRFWLSLFAYQIIVVAERQ